MTLVSGRLAAQPEGERQHQEPVIFSLRTLWLTVFFSIKKEVHRRIHCDFSLA
jgi:hypothetical protein